MLVYFAVFMAVLLFLASVTIFLFGSRREQGSRTFQRFCEVTGYRQKEEETVDLDEELLKGTFYERNIYPLLEKVASLIGGEGESKREKLERHLIAAGRPGNLGPNEFIALQLVLGLLSVSIVAIVALLVGPATPRGLALSIIFAAVAGIMVYVALDELLPAAQKYGEHHIAIYGLILGMLVMAVSLLML